MQIVSVEIRGLEEVKSYLETLEKDGLPNAGRGICKEIATKITQNAKAFAPVWKGTLRDSIRTETIDENTFGVSMADYGSEVETGHPVPFITPLIEQWAEEKSSNPIFAMLTLLREGAMPSPFITPAFDIVTAEIDEIIDRRIETALRTGR